MKVKIKKFVERVLMVIALVLSIFIICTILDERPTFADSGFSTSYDSGGSSYSGGSSWSSGSSYSGSRYSGSSSSSGVTSPLEVLFFLVFIVIFIISMRKNIGQNNNIPRNIPFDDSAIEAQIKQYIPDFNKVEFLNNGYKMYCDIQEAWMNFRLEDVKDIITDELYAMYESQLTTLEVKGEQNVMKGFELKRSFLKDCVKQNDTVTIKTGYIIEFYDYIAEQATGKVVRGTADKKMRVTYEMVFRQTLDESKKVTKCPNCGADIEMNTSGVCEYCHTKLVTENTKWVLTEKKTMNQEYV